MFWIFFCSGNIPGTLQNVVDIPRLYYNLVTGALPGGVPYTLKETVGGLTHGLKSKGNLLTKLTAALRGATGGAVDGAQSLDKLGITKDLTCK